MSRKRTLRFGLALAFLLASAGFFSAPVKAGFTTILDTDAPAVTSYLAATTELAIPGPSFSGLGSLTGPNLTVTFDTNLLVYKSEDWGTWSESPTPDVVWTTSLVNSVELTFSANSTVTTFGFEAQPNLLDTHEITAEFFNGAASLGTISFNVSGNGGARLFAATLDNFGADAGNTDKFTRVVVSSDLNFALGHLRYAATSTVVPEPATCAMLLGAVATGIPFWTIRRRRANQRRQGR